MFLLGITKSWVKVLGFFEVYGGLGSKFLPLASKKFSRSSDGKLIIFLVQSQRKTEIFGSYS